MGKGTNFIGQPLLTQLYLQGETSPYYPYQNTAFSITFIFAGTELLPSLWEWSAPLRFVRPQSSHL